MALIGNRARSLCLHCTKESLIGMDCGMGYEQFVILYDTHAISCFTSEFIIECHTHIGITVPLPVPVQGHQTVTILVLREHMIWCSHYKLALFPASVHLWAVLCSIQWNIYALPQWQDSYASVEILINYIGWVINLSHIFLMNVYLYRAKWLSAVIVVYFAIYFSNLHISSIQIVQNINFAHYTKLGICFSLNSKICIIFCVNVIYICTICTDISK